MKVTNTEKTKLGIFVILIGAILIIALYFIGKKQNLFGNTFKVTAVFSNVNGLKLGNNVRFSGINVGTVRNILMVDDSTICVDMIIDEEIRRHMKRSAVAVVGSDGLVGSMVVNIFPGGSQGDVLQEGDTIQSIKRKSSADMMSTLSVTNDNAAELSKELLKITKSINEGNGTLALLLNDEEMGSDLKETFQNLNQASVEASKAINEVKDFVNAVNDEDNLINVLVRDTASARQFRNIISNLEKSSEDIDLVIRNLNDFIVEIKESEGTLNYLVSDTILVQDIGETVKNIKKGSEMLNENLEALRHNTFFKGYFRKQEKERLKEEKRQKKLKE